MPPAFETAAQSGGLQSHIMAPQRMGYWIPNISVIRVLIMGASLHFHSRPNAPGPPDGTGNPGSPELTQASEFVERRVINRDSPVCANGRAQRTG